MVADSAGQTFRLGSLTGPVFLPSLFFSAGEAALIPIIPATALRLGADLPLAGIIAGMLMLGTLLADIPAARLVNRVGERRAMIIAASVAALGILLALVANNLWLLGFGVLAMGAAVAVFGLARHAFLTEHVPYSHRARSLAILGGMFRGGNFAGPMLGSLVIVLFGVSAAFYLGAALCIAAATLVLRTPLDRLADTPEVKPGATWQVAKREAKKLVTVGLGAGILGALRTTRAIGIPLIGLSIGLDEATLALLIGIGGALDFALFYTSGQVMDRFGRRWAAVPTLIGLGLTHLTVFMITDQVSFLAVVLLMALANGLGSGVILVLGSDLAPSGQKNEFLASYRLLVDGTLASTPPLLALIASFSTVAFAMGSFGVAGFFAAWLIGHYLPKFAPEPQRKG